MSDAKPTSPTWHAAKWNEPLIMELSEADERGIVPPAADAAIAAAVGDVLADLPDSIRRKGVPELPEVPQHRVVRHFTRLSQMCLGMDVAVDMMGTCTMKYSPKMHDHVSRQPNFSDLHPLQGEETMQGLLEVMYRFNRMMCNIAGMDEFTFQPASGAQGIYTNACLIRAYRESRGELGQRDEIITTAFSHPADAATPHVAGFKVITLMPGEMGYAGVDALKAAISDRTAGLMLTNPEDTGQYNPAIEEFVRLVHEAGGLCAYDQANGNPLLGVTRAGDAGFDMCQFNLHKTFSAPHAGIGMGCAAVGVKEHLRQFLPKPVITFDGERYHLEDDRPEAIDKIRSFVGNVHAVLKAYCWVMSLGAEGLRAVAETAVLNNNYMLARIREIDGVRIPWPKNDLPKLEQVRYSWEPLFEETGVSTFEIKDRMVDYGVQHYMESHVPMLVPQPFTIEPGESLTIEEMDQMIGALASIAAEARSEPDTIRTGPHNAAISRVDEDIPHDPDGWAFTWKAMQRKKAYWTSDNRNKIDRSHGGY
ncbi:MAG: aminomethyl-transferring glycine dehydrogenase subunit GcvPB [Alphaproteobacteria bacterium]|nr:aminomethyl-transferring glycine dehydrogenase subunit GcvPB [Alphaproteobacteria bacterium]